MINIIQNNDVYEIHFRYDPIVISLVKCVPGRRWNPEKKIWTVPKDKLGFLLNQFTDTPYESSLYIQSDENINVNARIDSTEKTAIPDIDISNVKFYVKKGSKPYEHQKDFMKFAIDRQNRGNMSGFILADEMGCGKTLETMNLAMYNKKEYGFRHCLIICCVNSSKYNWLEDIQIHTNGKEVPYILGSRKRKDGRINYVSGSKEKFEDLQTGYMYGKKEKGNTLPYFLIMNIEALRYKVGRTYPIVSQIADWINSNKLQMVILDEVHKNTSPSSIQGKQILKIKKQTGTKCLWVPMTGTPIISKPTDVFLPLKLVDGHSYSSFYTWCQEFCIYGGYGGYQIMGYRNIPNLKQLLQNNMLRRLKSEVLDLPDKVRYTEYVENSTEQQRLYEAVVSEIHEQRAEILSSVNPMAKLLRLRQVNGSPELVDNSIPIDNDYIKKNAKLQRLLEILEDIHSRNEKVIVFSNWVEPLRTLYKFVSKKYKTCCYTGTMSTTDRQLQKQKFIENPEYTVMIGTIGALGTSHTLTVANNVIFYDEPWTPADKEQAEDRCHRVGTKSSVNIFTIITKDTVDDRVHQILADKSDISKYIVDNQLNLRNNPDLFTYLLGDI